MIYEMAGRPPLDARALAGPAYTLNVEGTAVLFALACFALMGRTVLDTNTMEHLLGSDGRKPEAKASHSRDVRRARL
jgi:hypothetical protein